MCARTLDSSSEPSSACHQHTSLKHGLKGPVQFARFGHARKSVAPFQGSTPFLGAAAQMQANDSRPRTMAVQHALA